MVPTAVISALIVLLTGAGWMAGALRIELVIILLAVAFIGFRSSTDSRLSGSLETSWNIGGDGDHGCNSGDGCGGGD